MNTTDKNTLLEETGCLGRDLLLRYRDNRLSAEERHSVERHLVDCPLCSEALEGLALVSSPVVFDQLNDNIRQLTASGTPSASPRQYWMAAASVSVIVILSAYLYSEYRSVQHPVVVLQHEPAGLPAEENTSVRSASETATISKVPSAAAAAAPTPATAAAVAENNNRTAPVATQQQGEVAAADATTEAIAAEPVAEQKTEESTDAEPFFGFNNPPHTNQAAYPKLENPVWIDEKDNSKDKTLSETTSKKSVSMNGNTGTANAITYIQNLKVIDYNIDNSGNLKTGAPVKSVEPKYQNRQKKESTDASTAAETRRISYLELLGKPMSQYKNRNYQLAVAGFDEILVIHPGDQNAMFYKGLSLYNLQRFNDAIASLSGPGNDTSSTFNEEARYYMGKSYAALGNAAIAKDIFNALVAGNGFYAASARAELEKLK